MNDEPQGAEDALFLTLKGCIVAKLVHYIEYQKACEVADDIIKLHERHETAYKDWVGGLG